MNKVIKNIIIIFICFFMIISSDLTSVVQLENSIIGNWMSKPGQFKIVFRVSKNKDGTLTAFSDFPDQEAWDIPVDLILSDSLTVRFDIYNIRCVYEGRISDDKQTIDGEFKGPDGSGMPLVLERVDNPPVRTSERPQEPKKPYPYNEEKVFFENKKDKVTLAGTLTLPESNKSCPAVLLISGSGPNDRDELIWGHRVFLVLADYLTRQGVAVLRYDDRGVGRSTGDYDIATFDDFKRDALAGFEYLRTRPEIDAKNIGIIGHSEGGAIAPLAASKSPEVAFIVLMSAPGYNFIESKDKGLISQWENSYRNNGATEEAISFKCDLLYKMFIIAKEETDKNIAKNKIRELLKESESSLLELSEDDREKIELESIESYDIDWMLSTSFLNILKYDPKSILSSVHCPVLAIHGSNDTQIPIDNLKGVEAALKAGGNYQFTIKELPGLNHLFQTAQTGSSSEYMMIEETISPTVLHIISDWIQKQSSNL